MLEAAISKGRKLPDWYLDEPPLNFGDEIYIKAFWELSTCRQIGMSEGPIPWIGIVEYCKHKGIYEVDDFVEIIRALDSAYLEFRGKEIDASTKSTKGVS